MENHFRIVFVHAARRQSSGCWTRPFKKVKHTSLVWRCWQSSGSENVRSGAMLPWPTSTHTRDECGRSKQIPKAPVLQSFFLLLGFQTSFFAGMNETICFGITHQSKQTRYDWMFECKRWVRINSGLDIVMAYRSSVYTILHEPRGWFLFGVLKHKHHGKLKHAGKGSCDRQRLDVCILEHRSVWLDH